MSCWVGLYCGCSYRRGGSVGVGDDRHHFSTRPQPPNGLWRMRQNQGLTIDRGPPQTRSLYHFPRTPTSRSHGLRADETPCCSADRLLYVDWYGVVLAVPGLPTWWIRLYRSCLFRHLVGCGAAAAFNCWLSNILMRDASLPGDLLRGELTSNKQTLLFFHADYVRQVRWCCTVGSPHDV
jgi:hypothetical protein